MENSVPFYIIDDDESILSTFTKVINKVYPQASILYANDGLEAWNYIKENQNPMIIICEANITGLSGIQLQKKIRTLENPSHYFFIIISSYIEFEYAIAALQSGVDDFIKKPLAIDDILAKLKLAQRVINQQILIETKDNTINQLSDELSRDTENLKDMLIYFLNMKIPDYSKKINKIIDKTKWISSELLEPESEELQEIEKAAQLCLIGKIALPDNLFNSQVLVDGQVTNDKMSSFPVNAKQIISKIRNYEKVSNIIYHIYENFDGTGIPDRIKGWQIPLGSRILRIILDFEYFVNIKGMSSHKAIETLEHESQRLYDFRIITLLDQYDAVNGFGRGLELPVKIKDITEGMVISRDIITQSGIKILGRMVKMDQDKIEKLAQITSSDPVIGKICIKI